MPIKKSEIPRFVRKAWQSWRTATIDLRKAEEERLGFYLGGEKQWRETEIAKRKAQGRPFISDNRCKPAVDQVEGDIRKNPPGPQILPVGDGADDDTAAIHEGLIRECEIRSNAQVAYITAARYNAASGYGVIELATEYTSEKGFDQQLRIDTCEDPAMWFFDPAARKADRSDALWAGKIKLYSREQYIAEFGDKNAVLNQRSFMSALGDLQSFVGVDSELSQINDWTGKGKGPFIVVEFYMVEIESVKLRQYTDHINRYDDDPEVKSGEVEATPIPEDDGGLVRTVPRRKIKKYLVDALEVKGEPTEWLGTVIPAFPVLGQEIYIQGKLYRLSLISEAMDNQRGLNYAITTAAELAGLMPKAPWIGYKGQFLDEKWKSANSEMWAYLEVEPAYAVNPVTSESELLPPPQRNTWETPIQWLLLLKQSFVDGIKATTSIFDPSLGNAKADQSGRAIDSLRSESSTGTFFVADNLHHAIQSIYEQIVLINQQILTGPRVVTIVRPNSQHEQIAINQEFTQEATEQSEKAQKAIWLNQGRFAVAVTVGPNFQTIKEQTSALLTDFLKIDPAILQVPGVAASALRSISQGDPEILAIADLLEPNAAAGPQQIAQLQQTNQALTALVQKMHMEKLAKLPDLALRKYETDQDNRTKVAVAQINASLDADQRGADLMEHLTGLAHDVALQKDQQQHDKGMAQMQAENASALSAQNGAQTPEPEPAGTNQ